MSVHFSSRVQVWGLHVMREGEIRQGEGGDKEGGRGLNQERGGSAEGFQRGDDF